MIILFQLLLLAGLVLIVLQIVKMLRSGGAIESAQALPAAASAQEALPPANRIIEALNTLEIARAELQKKYPLTVAMLGGYLNNHSISEAASLDAAVATMIKEWSDRRNGLQRELSNMLSDYDLDTEIQAVIITICDVELKDGEYRPWLTWLLGQFTK